MPDKHRILCTRRMPPNVEARLARDYDATLQPRRPHPQRGQLPEGQRGSARGSSAPAAIRWTAGVIERLPDSVKILATYSVGYEHIAVDAAKARGIVVANTPGVLNDATADVAILCLLGAARRGAEGDRMVRAGEWVGWHSTMMLGVHVTGKRLGVFGMGRIGRAVARRAAASTWRFTITTAAASPRRSRTARSGTTPRVAARGERLPLDQRPLDPGDARIPRRGAHRAPARRRGGGQHRPRGPRRRRRAHRRPALGQGGGGRSRRLRGEPNLDPRYRELDNTFLLPHLGSASFETRDAMGYCCLDNLDAFFAGHPCPNAL